MAAQPDKVLASEPNLPGPVQVKVRGRGVAERRQVITPAAARQMLHELRVHQTELQTQNEELRRTHLELDATRARYLDLYDLAPVGYCTVGETEQILFANLTAATLLGVNCASMPGRPIQQFILPADQDVYYLHRKKLYQTGQPQTCELRMLKKGGIPFWAQIMATRTQTPDGVDAHRLVLSDITQRKEAQDRVNISDVALKSITEGVLITTPELYIVSANEAFLSMTGYTERELVGAHCSMFNGPLTDGDTKTRFIQATQASQSFSGEVLNYRKDGSSFWNQLSLSPVLDEQGKLSNFISINTDISERKRLEQTLLEKNQELLRATGVAEKANRAKSEFLSSMSHELRSPLHSILGFAQLLEAGTPALTPSQQGKNQQILSGGWHLLTLINEILDLALIESGKLALALEPLPLAPVLLDCESMIEPQAQSSGIRVNFSRIDSELLVIADAVRLKQVLVNLLSNAIKYNRVGGSVDVTVSTGSLGRLRISVHDTGQGLSDEKVAQLFQPFNRLGQEGSETEGTGIGLVVARRLTELMAGTIGVQSTVGVGSVFWLELGIAPPLTTATEVRRIAGQQGLTGAASPNLSHCTVLYVDENFANMELVDQILADRPKLQLLKARDGIEGIEMARAHLPQVILMDINMPGLSGVEVLKILRQDPATRHIPVLALSANAMPLDVVKGLSAGFFRYLTKPFMVEEFLKVLDLALAFALAKSPPPHP